MDEKRAEEISLQIKRTINAPREKVYRAWTDPQELKQWFAPSKDFKTLVPQMDVRSGGNYRVEMHAPDGKIHKLVGRFQEVQPPAKLVYTWRWESNPDEEETLVTVEFHDAGAGTELVLTHERFANEQRKQEHDHGWIGCLGRLAEHFTHPGL